MNRCPSCGDSNSTKIYDIDTSRHFVLRRCRHCHLVFATPTPSQQELVEFYASGYFTESDKETGYTDYWGVGEQNMRKMWSVFKRYANLDTFPNRSILDVGCASGGFLYEATKEGWDTAGVEFAEDAVARAKEVYKLYVRQGDLFSDTLDMSQFGIITLWHVLEHIPEPLPTLCRAYELLAHDGLLFVEVPNWNSLGRVIKGRNWKQILPPAHLNYFTQSSIRRIVNEAGFNVIKTSTHHIVGFDKIAAGTRPRFFKQMCERIETTVGHLGYGGYLRILAKKPSASP